VDKRRVVRTRVPIGGGQFVFGTGYLVAAHRVLTARHVLTPGGDVPPLGLVCQVRVWPCGPAEEWVTGSLAWLHPSRDVALVAVDGLGVDLPPVGWGVVSGDQPVEWVALGYPVASLDEDNRVEEQAYGRLAPSSAESTGGLALTVESRRPAEGSGGHSGWEGLSGAAVFTGSRLIGIVTADPSRWEDSLVGIRSAPIIEPPEIAEQLGAPATLVPVTGRPLPEAPAPGVPAQDGPSPEPWLRVKGARVSTAVDFWRDREQIRANIREALFQGSAGPRILSVTGHRGIGKSAIAAKVAAEFERPDPARSPAEDFDALVYASPRTGAGALTLADVYHSVAGLLDERGAGRLQRLWETSQQDALPDLWEAMRHRRTLIVLDNLDDLQDPDTGVLRDLGIVAFLASICATPYPPHVLTTSVMPLGLPVELSAYLRPFPVSEGLGVEDALALLRSRDRVDGFAHLDDEELRKAVERLHGLPYGIDLLAQKLTQDPVYMADLLDSPRTFDELIQQLVPSVFFSLDEPSRKVVQLLALSSVPLPDRAVPVILDGLADADVLRGAVRALVGNGGLQFDPVARTLRLHPVEVDWVSEQLLSQDPAQQVALDLRLADWYRGQRRPPSQWRRPEDVVAQRREFHHRWRAGERDEALVVLAQVARFLARRGDAGRVRTAVEHADAVELGPRGLVAREQCRYHVEFFTGSSDRAEQAAEAAVDAAEAARMADAATEMRVELATVWRHRGESDRAIEALLAVTSAEPQVEREVRLEALFELGMAFCYAKRWPEAISIADELADTVGPSDPPQLACRPADIRALARFGAGDYQGALAAAGEAERLYLDSPTQDNAGYAYGVAGLAWLALDDLEQAAAQFDSGERLGAEYNVDRLAGICATNQAWTQLRAGNRDGALAAARRADTLLSGTRAGIAAVPHTLAELLSPGTGLDPLTALRQAAAAASDNPDVYSPSEKTCAAIAATLLASGDKVD
jgi:tetratricopeptide (TPR) repeat protein